MTVSAHVQTFLNKRVTDYETGKALADLDNVVYRIKVAYDNEDLTLEEQLDAFANDPQAARVQELIIGMFALDSSFDTSDVITKLISLKDKLPQLKAIFLGDITFEECEISWIQQTDMTPLLNNFPALTHFQVRGGDNLRFLELKHNNLKTLIVETGGLSPETLSDIMKAELPQLEQLSLWLGDENYGFNSSVGDLSPILSGEAFPTLKHLGLMNSELQDEIAVAVCKSAILPKLEILDLSMGTMTDIGGKALLECPGIRHLKLLNLRRHYLSDDMMKQLAALGLNINLDDQEEADEDDFRYVEVSE